MPDDRSHERSSKIGIWVGLLGVIVGGILAGVPTLIASSTQIAAEDTRASATFLREQQQRAYGDFITAERAAREAYNAFREIFLIGVRDSPDARSSRTLRKIRAQLPEAQETVTSTRGEMEAAIRQLSGALGVVQLVGSPQASDIATSIYKTHEEIEHLSLDVYTYQNPNTEPDTSWREGEERATNELVATVGRLDTSVSEFVRQARVDVGTG
jgi:hypothetical protein